MVLLVDLVIQNLTITLAIFHLPIQVSICVYFSKPSPYSFVFTHAFKLCGLMQTDFLKVSGRFLLKELLIFFIDIDLNFWFRVGKVVDWFAVGLTYFLSSFSCLLLVFGLVLRFYADSLVVLAPFGLVA